MFTTDKTRKKAYFNLLSISLVWMVKWSLIVWYGIIWPYCDCHNLHKCWCDICIGPLATNLINMSKWTTAEFWPPTYKSIKHTNFLSQEKTTHDLPKFTKLTLCDFCNIMLRIWPQIIRIWDDRRPIWNLPLAALLKMFAIWLRVPCQCTTNFPVKEADEQMKVPSTTTARD